MRNARSFWCWVALISSPVAAEEPLAPKLVSPGGGARESRLGTPCPSFSWTAVPAAKSYALVVYEVPASGPSEAGSRPLLNIEVPGGATSWTPSLDECLPSEGRFSWTVGARLADGRPRWSEPGLFRVVGAESRPVPRREGSPPSEVPAIVAPTPDTPAVPGTDVAPPTRSTGEAFAPPACTGAFTDVLVGNPYCSWIEQLVNDEIATECGPSKYCPDNPVTRGQLAAYLGRAIRGTDAWVPSQGGGANPILPPGLAVSTALDTAGDVGKHTSITIGSDGLGLISYYDVTNGNLKVAHCSNIQCSSATITPLDTAGDVGQFTSITIGTDGLGLISYYKGGSDGDLKVAHCSNVACTVATITNLDDPASEASDVGRGTAITITDGKPLIAYYDLTLGNLKIVICANESCTSAQDLFVADSTGDVGEYPAVALNLFDVPVISYFDDTNDALKLIQCTYWACNPASSSTVNTGALVTGHTSIAVRNDNRVIISFQGDGGLMTAICPPIGGCPVPAVYGHSGEGLYNSVTVGLDGQPLTSTYDSSDGFPTVVHCSDANCDEATYGLPEFVLASEDRGSYSSITIGADGLPLLSYYDILNHDLRVAHCSNQLCSQYFRRR